MPRKDEYITISEAAKRAGYRSTAGLRRAAQSGQLKAIQAGPRAWLTTPAWLDAYVASRRPWGKVRGQPNSERAYKTLGDGATGTAGE